MHFGEDSMERLIQLLHLNLEEKLGLSLDWSKFDQTIPAWLIEAAFQILYDHLDFDTITKGNLPPKIQTKEKSTEKQKRIFWAIKDYFINTKIMCPNSTVYQKNQGIPSGSYLTQLVGSLINMLVQAYLFREINVSREIEKYLGDDSFQLIDEVEAKRINLKVIGKIALEKFGLILNVNKCSQTQQTGNIKFLGYQCYGGRLFRTTDEWFKLVLYPERAPRTFDQSASRVYAYYLLGGINDPEYCMFYKRFFQSWEKSSFEYYPGEALTRMSKYVLGKEIHKQGSEVKVYSGDIMHKAFKFNLSI